MSDDITAISNGEVRYLTAYTPDNPPPPLKTWWVSHNGPDLEIIGQHVVGREDTDD
jgi:hypothetical protein